MEIKKSYNTIDEYISAFPEEVQTLLLKIRNVIKEIAPEAEEKISYQMPAFFQNGVLVYFGAFKDHIGFFPTGNGIEAFLDELSEYKTSKGTIQFPYGKPIPYDLIKRIVLYRVKENETQAESKIKKINLK